MRREVGPTAEPASRGGGFGVGDAVTEFNIEQAMVNLANALPETSRALRSKTKREVSLTFYHYAVALGEWGGDFDGEGNTPKAAIDKCLLKIEATK
jgi:hypothetical protein